MADEKKLGVPVTGTAPVKANAKLEVKPEDKEFDTYPAGVEERYDRERKETLERNKAERLEQIRRNGLLECKPVEEDEKKESKAEKEAKEKKEALLKDISKLLEESDNRESAVPANSPYWSKVAELRTLSNP